MNALDIYNLLYDKKPEELRKMEVLIADKNDDFANYRNELYTALIVSADINTENTNYLLLLEEN